jgi:hypothetical protein
VTLQSGPVIAGWGHGRDRIDPARRTEMEQSVHARHVIRHMADRALFGIVPAFRWLRDLAAFRDPVRLAATVLLGLREVADASSYMLFPPF